MAINKPQILEGNKLQEFLRAEVQQGLLNKGLEVLEITEFYLVNLLMRFARTEDLFIPVEGGFKEEPLALMLARAVSGDTSTQIRELKRLGDISLYITGLFEERVKKGPVGVGYYVDMGSGAYGTLAGQLANEDVFEELYAELSDNFYNLAKVIGDLSVAEFIGTNSELLVLYERWLITGNEKIRRRLVQEGLNPINKKISC